jgi:hypothetical protein
VSKEMGMVTSDELAAKRFCVLFCGLLSALLVSVLGLVAVVDPYGEFGTGLFRPIVASSRAQKLKSFARMDVNPEVLILGSSRVMKIEPDYVRSLTGLSVFNLGVESARTEDYYVLLRFALSLGKPVKMVVLGIDDEAFSNSAEIDSRLKESPELSRYLDSAHRQSTFARSLSRIMSFSAVSHSFHAIRLNWCGFPPESQVVDPSNGFLTYVDWERELVGGNYDLQSKLAASRDEYLRRYEGFTEVAEWRKQYFRKFVALCGEQRIQVHCFVTPLHPEVQVALTEKRQLLARHREVVEFVQGFAGEPRFNFRDLSLQSSFGGDPAAFYDGGHAREANLRLLVSALLRPLTPGGHAVQ